MQRQRQPHTASLKDLRQAVAVPVRDLAADAGVSPATVSRIELGLIERPEIETRLRECLLRRAAERVDLLQRVFAEGTAS